MPGPSVSRYLNAGDILDKRSRFLFGPRQTGKSTLIRQQLGDYPVYKLLDQTLFVRLARNRALIREALTPGATTIVIDEIQKMPELLNEVQLMIEEHGIRFFLTGSSARALRRKGVNLLGGRARSWALHPFVRAELSDRFDLHKALEYGLLPPVYFSDAPTEDLAAYTGAYLKEEVAAERVEPLQPDSFNCSILCDSHENRFYSSYAACRPSWDVSYLTITCMICVTAVMIAAGAFSINVAWRCSKSKDLIWYDKIAPSVSVASSTTSSRTLRTLLVIGATSANPVCSLNVFRETTYAGLRLVISLPTLGSKSNQMMSPRSGMYIRFHPPH